MSNLRHPLSDIAWDVPEEVYRQDPALSYSTLAKYEREGRFTSLPTLFDRISTPSLTFGSIVDALVTGGEQEFRDRFTIIDSPGLSDTMKTVVETLYGRCKVMDTPFDDISDDTIADVTKECDFYANDKYRNYRIKLVREQGKPYYNMLRTAEGKTAVTPEDVSDARRCVEVLKTSEFTEKYFKDYNAPGESGNMESYYQLKFKGEDKRSGVQYRCMADLILVDHEAKVITPCDLKTSSHPEWEFGKSFTQWRYDIQARLYWRMIRQNMDKDGYYKDFELLNYRFIVVNKKTLSPVVWKYGDTQCGGNLEYIHKNGGLTTFRDPYVIGKELHDYLEKKPKYPFEIKELNSIEWFLEHE